MAYVYRHIRLDTNQPFYVGIGSDSDYKRAASKKDRNKHWKNIVSSNEYKIDILFDDISWEEACEKEKEFIALYGRRDLKTGTLVNLTNGGDGSLNRKMSDKAREALLKANKGKILTDSHKAKISQNNAKSKNVIDISTGVIYKSVREASDKTGIGYSCLKNMLIGNRANKTSLAYYN